uniref:Uncharacterized protein n=1 Tax=Strongyloides stercoralis TaxID=6248 RepID=A0AAF5DQV7_STRER
MEAVVGGIGGCCSTKAEPKTWNGSFFLLGGIHLVIMLITIESRHYYYCFGGCYSTGTESEALRLFWSNVGDVSLLQLNLKHGISFVKDSFNNNANFDKKKT